MASLSTMKRPSLIEESIDHAFPQVEPGVIPFGSSILVQLKNSATVTKAGLQLLKDAVQTENDTTQVAKVIAMGPVAFCNRETGKLWVEGRWAEVGDYVRIPLYTTSQKSWSVEVPGRDYRITFVLVDDLMLGGKQTDPFYPRNFL